MGDSAPVVRRCVLGAARSQGLVVLMAQQPTPARSAAGAALPTRALPPVAHVRDGAGAPGRCKCRYGAGRLIGAKPWNALSWLKFGSSVETVERSFCG